MNKLDEKKRVTIPLSLYNTLYDKYLGGKRSDFTKKGDEVASSIQKTHNELNQYKEKDCVELDEQSKARIEILLKMGICESREKILKEAIQFFTDAKKNEIKELVDSL